MAAKCASSCGDQGRVGLGGETLGECERTGGRGGQCHQLRSEVTSAKSDGAHTRTSAPSVHTGDAGPTTGSAPPRDPSIDNNTCTSLISHFRRFGPRPAIVRDGGGLAASPPVRYKLRVARSGKTSLPFLFSAFLFSEGLSRSPWTSIPSSGGDAPRNAPAAAVEACRGCSRTSHGRARLDDMPEMFPRLRQDRDVLERAAALGPAVGLCADGECAHPAFLAQEARGGRGGGADQVGGGLHLGTQVEPFVKAARRWRGPGAPSGCRTGPRPGRAHERGATVCVLTDARHVHRGSRGHRLPHRHGRRHPGDHRRTHRHRTGRASRQAQQAWNERENGPDGQSGGGIGFTYGARHRRVLASKIAGHR